MCILSDREIEFYAMNRDMIDPYAPELISHRDEKIVSFGQSSYGYDIRCADEFMIFSRKENMLIDPKNLDDSFITYKKGTYVDIPPNSFILTRSVEYIKMPPNVTGIVLGKSTYARCGIDNLATPLEAGWEGHITLEFSNNTPNKVRMYANEGVAQVLFFEGNTQCRTTYADRSGKYQGQRGITLAKV